MSKNKSIVKNLAYKVNHGPLDVDKLAQLIEKGYDTYNQQKERRKRSFSPSTIVYGHGKCPRYWYIAFDGAMFVEANDPESIANMKNGIASHERLGEVLERSGVDITGLEVKIENEDPPIFGYIDAIINRAGQEVIGEIKTARLEAFRSRQAKMKAPNYHVIQVMIYMYLRGAESGFLLYENKNDHQLLIIPVYMDDEKREYMEYLMGWMRDVYGFWKDGKLNKIPFRSNAKECKTCPVRDVCFDSEQYGEGEDLIDPLRLLQ